MVNKGKKGKIGIQEKEKIIIITTEERQQHTMDINPHPQPQSSILTKSFFSDLLFALPPLLYAPPFSSSSPPTPPPPRVSRVFGGPLVSPLRHFQGFPSWIRSPFSGESPCAAGLAASLIRLQRPPLDRVIADKARPFVLLLLL